MTYTPQPGDRVTSPLLVGEWEVVQAVDDGWCDLKQNNARTSVKAKLTPVAPPLPPEPAVGSVVRAHGKLWQHDGGERTWVDGHCAPEAWADLATAPDLSPVVAVDDVADWLRRGALADGLRAEFGGWDK